MRLYHQDEYTVRKLLPREWRALKDIRLKAVQAEPNVFVATYDDQILRPDREWKAMLEDSDRAYFILVHGGHIVGLSGVARHGEDPVTGVLVLSYIDKVHRNRGLSNLFYQARLDWAVRKGLRKVIVSHRKDNKASKAAIKKFHFEYTHTEMKKWPDGTKEEQLFYQLDLKKWQDVFGV